MAVIQFKKKIKIRPLTKEDAQGAAMLYAFSAKNDEYFISIFGEGNVERSVLENFSCDVYNAIVHGCSIGAFYKDKLIGIVLGFNIIDWKNNHRKEYEHIFQTDDDFITTVKQFIKAQKNDLLYVFAVCVAEEHRCRHVAKDMIAKLCKMYCAKFSIVSDAYSYVAVPMWLSNKFIEVNKDGVDFVYRE